MAKVKAAAKKALGFVKDKSFYGQAIAKIAPEQLVGRVIAQDALGYHLINGIVGGVGLILNEAINKNTTAKELGRVILSNVAMEAIPTRKEENLGFQWKNFTASLKGKQYNKAFGSLFAEPQNIVNQAKSAWSRATSKRMGMGSSSASLSGNALSASPALSMSKPIGNDRNITEVIPSSISAYTTKYGSPITNKDIVNY